MALIDDYPLLNDLTKQSDGSFHPADIKAEIEKRGMTLAQLSIEAGLTANAVSIALKQSLKSGELAVSEFLNIPVHLLFPTRWDMNQNRVRPRYADKYSTVAELLS